MLGIEDETGLRTFTRMTNQEQITIQVTYIYIAPDETQ